LVDGDAVSRSDLKEWSAEFEEVIARIERLFVHPNSYKHAEQYLRGLLAPIERKNGWTVAEFVGVIVPDSTSSSINVLPRLPRMTGSVALAEKRPKTAHHAREWPRPPRPGR
jgi:hypothetical protein